MQHKIYSKQNVILAPPSNASGSVRGVTIGCAVGQWPLGLPPHRISDLSPGERLRRTAGGGHHRLPGGAHLGKLQHGSGTAEDRV